MPVQRGEGVHPPRGHGEPERKPRAAFGDLPPRASPSGTRGSPGLDPASPEGVEGQSRLQLGSWLWWLAMVATGRALLPPRPPPDTGAAFRDQFHISSLSCSRPLLPPCARAQGKLLGPNPRRVCPAAQGDTAWKRHGREVPGGAVIPHYSFCSQPLSPISGSVHVSFISSSPLKNLQGPGSRWDWGCSQSCLCHVRFQGQQHPDPSRDPTARKDQRGGAGGFRGNQERGETGKQWQSWAVEPLGGIQGWIQLPFLAGGISR